MEGDTKMKRIQTICNLLLAVIVFISNSRVVFANSCSEYDYFLASAGVPHGSLGGHWGAIGDGVFGPQMCPFRLFYYFLL